MAVDKPVYANRRNEDLAYARGLDGTPAPDWVKNDPTFFTAYKRGLDNRAAHGKPAANAPARSGGGRGRASRARSAANYTGRAFSVRGAARRVGIPKAAAKVSRAGDSGGLLLALVVYPIVLATIKYGPTGPMAWFRAKWLNEPATAADLPKQAAPAPPQQTPGRPAASGPNAANPGTQR